MKTEFLCKTCSTPYRFDEIGRKKYEKGFIHECFMCEARHLIYKESVRQFAPGDMRVYYRNKRKLERYEQEN
jgi:hypothetical protein